MQRATRGAVGAAVAIAIACTGLGSASATEPQSDATAIAEFIDQVRPNEVTNESVTLVEGALTRASADTAAEVPATSAGELTVTGDSGVPITVKLPGNGADASIAPDGTVVYGEEAGVTVAVQVGADEARVHTVMADARAAQDVEYVFTDLTPELNEDGSVSLFATATTEEGSIELSVGSIDAPWAADADGNALATTYRVEGSSVVQEVAVDENTAFPIVSDPSFQGDCGIVTCTIRFDRAWTKKIRDFGGDAGAIAGAIATAATAVAGPVGAAVGAAAGVIVGVRAHIFSTQAGDFYSNGNCFGVKFPPIVQLGWGTQVTRGTYNCA
ncbi:hypothetical protein MHY85_02325 [Cellulomonas sp. ACRRI]|uniref:hypothetical protein n=1 Tax=Cellulomonas sp. ACRRI TaxID=2918188 RepID=UPI001EF22201|nr:hypothetical protein [Cellulomonas sp. ACRRI]MCG7284807.1 hypothetical protein [Cellulomonas sp. ACRRI]